MNHPPSRHMCVVFTQARRRGAKVGEHSPAAAPQINNKRDAGSHERLETGRGDDCIMCTEGGTSPPTTKGRTRIPLFEFIVLSLFIFFSPCFLFHPPRRRRSPQIHAGPGRLCRVTGTAAAARCSFADL